LWGVGAALVYTAPRKTLRITGRAPTAYSHSQPPPPVSWGNTNDLTFFETSVAAGYGPEHETSADIRAKLDHPSGVPAADLAKYLRHFSPEVRSSAARILSLRADAPALAEIEAACRHADVRVRRAGFEALAGYHSWKLPMAETAMSSLTVSTQFMGYIQTALDNTNAALWETDGALLALAHAEPGDILANRSTIEAWLDHPEWWLRRSAALALTRYPSNVSPDVLNHIADTYKVEGHRDPALAYSWGLRNVLTAGGMTPPPTLPEREDFVRRIGQNMHYPTMVGGGFSWDPYMIFYAHAEESFDIFNSLAEPSLIQQMVDHVVQLQVHVQQNILYDVNAQQVWNDLTAIALATGEEWIAQTLKLVLADLDTVLLNPGDPNRNTLLNLRNTIGAGLTTYELNHGPVPGLGLKPVALAPPMEIVFDHDGDGFGEVVFNGSMSHDPDGNILQHAWEWNHRPLGLGPTNSVNLPVGQHTILLRVTDNQAQFSTSSLTVVVMPPCTTNALLGPTAAIGSPIAMQPSGTDPSLIEIRPDGTGSSDPDGEILYFIWETNGVPVGAGPTPRLDLPPGTHTLSLLVADNDGHCDRVGLPPISVGEETIFNHPPPQALKGGAVLFGTYYSAETSLTRIYWGPSDGGTNPAQWSSSVTRSNTGPGQVSTTVSNLLFGRVYYYRAYMSNSLGQAWADQSTLIKTLNPSPGVVTPGLQLWLDAEQSEFSFTSGNNVDVWMDRSGHGRHALRHPEAGAAAIQRIDHELNGKATVRFGTGGPSDVMTLTAPVVLDTAAGRPGGSAFIVAHTTDATGEDTLMTTFGANRQFF
ncbi:MAG: hypothetical protein AAF492_08885, partial [Verrucomicrobiota bacterium]